jgi:hypothetical protein
MGTLKVAQKLAIALGRSTLNVTPLSALSDIHFGQEKDGTLVNGR